LWSLPHAPAEALLVGAGFFCERADFVFLDPGGKRWIWVRAIVGIGLLGLLSLLVIFIRALWVKPDISDARCLERHGSRTHGAEQIGQLRGSSRNSEAMVKWDGENWIVREPWQRKR
jgi:hypothetical protein